MENKPIMLIGGGTGGHLFAAIALQEQLNQRGYTTQLVTDQRCKKYLPADQQTAIIFSSYMNTTNIVQKIFSAASLALAIVRALILLSRTKPKLIVGFGGYTGFAILVAAVILNIPIILCEQNSILGQAHRILMPYAKFLATAYQNTGHIKLKHQDKVVFCGNIIRSPIQSQVKANIDSGIFKILIFGGSQGSRVLTDLLPAALAKLRQLAPNLKIKLFQQVQSELEILNLTSTYQKLHIDCELQLFFHNIAELYQQADLAITRAGAGTIAELQAAQLPAILIPYPKAKDNHQYWNAVAACMDEASWLYNEAELTPEILADKLFQLTSNPDLLLSARSALQNSSLDGAAKLAELVHNCKS